MTSNKHIGLKSLEFSPFLPFFKISTNLALFQLLGILLVSNISFRILMRISGAVSPIVFITIGGMPWGLVLY